MKKDTLERILWGAYYALESIREGEPRRDIAETLAPELAEILAEMQGDSNFPR